MVVVCTLSWRGVWVGLKEGKEKKERRYRVTSEEITEKSCTSFKDFFKEELLFIQQSLIVFWTWKQKADITDI